MALLGGFKGEKRSEMTMNEEEKRQCIVPQGQLGGAWIPVVLNLHRLKIGKLLVTVLFVTNLC